MTLKWITFAVLLWIYQLLIQVPICLKLGRPAHAYDHIGPLPCFCTLRHKALVLCFDTPTVFSVYNSNSCWVSQKYTVFGFLKKDFKEAHQPNCSYGCPHLANKCPRSLVANSVSTCRHLFPNSAGPCILPHHTPHPHEQVCLSPILYKMWHSPLR